MSESDCGHGALLALDEAIAQYHRQLRPLPVQRAAPDALRGQMLAQDVFAQVDLPTFTQSAVDGYALRSADTQAASAAQPARLPVVAEVRAGIEAAAPLAPGEAMRIFTGGRVPEGADTIARQEIVRRDGRHLLLAAALPAGTDIRPRGEELRAGARVASAGQRLHSGLIAALAMAGAGEVAAYRAPRVRVLITGDEISSAPAGGAQVFDANGPLTRSWFAERGYALPECRLVADTREDLQAALREALDEADLVITTGGVSVGDYDLVRPVSVELGVKEIFWQVAQKPGKPLYFGLREEAGAQKVIMGLPGNPGAVLACLQVHVAEVLAALGAGERPCWRAGVLTAPLRADSREQLLRMRLALDETGRAQLTPLPRQASHMLSNMAQASALVRIAPGRAVQAGETAQWLALP